ncbi:MAG: 2,3-bisphosphoglycerate-independent phosphoglycerate mutase [Myxococcota bacterium]
MKLERSGRFPEPRGPVVFVVMDGVGVGPADEGNAVTLARTPHLDALRASASYCEVAAHGRAVGLPSDDDMGNSEVGHNALGAGRVFAQGAKLVNEAIASGRMFEGDAWKQALARATAGGALHFMGLLSDGNVHSHIDHLETMIGRAVQAGAGRVFVHALLDGRDVGETTSLEYIDRLESFLDGLRGEGRTLAIASGGGRMKVTMDRYEADWGMVELGWKTHVRGDGERFSSARAAVQAFRDREPGLIDQYLPAFVVGEDAPVGPITDGDAVLFFNFRGDRALEMSRAFDEEELDAFDRGPRPDVFFAGMMEYDGDLHIPRNYLVSPPSIDRTMAEHLAATGVTQWAASETQKFGHVTYFWNGNRSGRFSDELETYVQVDSDNAPFEERPWMKAAEITDAAVAAIASGQHRFLRLNLANGDMVGHTGVRDSAIMALEAVDLCVQRLRVAVEAADGILIVTADHGNAEEMYMKDKKGNIQRDEAGKPKAKTSHTLNPVPVYLLDSSHRVRISARDGAGLTHLTATVLECLGLQPPTDYDPSLLDLA